MRLKRSSAIGKKADNTLKVRRQAIVGHKHEKEKVVFVPDNTFVPATVQRLQAKCFFSSANAKKQCIDNVTFGVTCYDEVKYAESALNSIFFQCSKAKVILIDDNPASYHKCSKHLNKINYPFPYSTIRNQNNLGLALSRNKLAAAAKKLHNTKWIVFLDADDTLTKDALATMAANSPKNVDIVSGSQFFFKTDASNDTRITSGTTWQLTHGINKDSLKKKGQLPVVNMIRTDFLLEIGGFPSDMIYGNEDWVFWTKMMHNNAILHVTENFMSCYRLKPFSMSKTTQYQQMATDMFKLHFADDLTSLEIQALLNKVVHHMQLDGSTPGLRLEQSLYGQPLQCVGYALLSLWKSSWGCNACAIDTFNCQQAITARLALPAEFNVIKEAQHLIDTKIAENTVSTHSYGIEQQADVIPELPLFSAHLLKEDSKNIPPPLLHFTFGLSDTPPLFSIHHYIAVKMGYFVYSPMFVYIHIMLVPHGKWWEEIAKDPNVKVIQWPRDDIVNHQGSCFFHHSHRADLVRLKALQKYGGVYMDLDFIAVRPLRYVYGKELYIGKQESQLWSWRRPAAYYGLCNAFMASVPNSKFVNLWLESYKSFRSYGHDAFWDEHSVRVPAELYDRHDELLVEVLPSQSLYMYLWHEQEKKKLVDTRYRPAHKSLASQEIYTLLLKENPQIYGFHLWASQGSLKEYNSLAEGCQALDGSIYGTAVCLVHKISSP